MFKTRFKKMWLVKKNKIKLKKTDEKIEKLLI